MRTQNRSIMMFFLIVAGVILGNLPEVRAENGIDLGDGICSEQEEIQNLCINAGGYVIEALLCDNGNWPCSVEGSDLKAFKYRATAPAGCTDPTWSYTITQWEICSGTSVDYIVDTDPSGSALTLPTNKVSKCPEIGYEEGYELFKLNPTLKCSDATQSIDFTIYAAGDSGLSCGNETWVRTSDGCLGGELRGPGCSTGASMETTRVFENGDTTVNYDICFGAPTSVTFAAGETEQGIAWICGGGNPLEVGTEGCTGVVNAGPDSSGCLIQGSSTYLYGGTAYVRSR